MEDRFDRLETKIDVMSEKQTEFAVAMASLAGATQNNTASLQEHMSQTNEVKKQTQMLFEGLRTMKEDFDTRLKPTENFVDRAKFLGAVAAFVLSTVLGLYAAGFLHR